MFIEHLPVGLHYLSLIFTNILSLVHTSTFYKYEPQ